MPLTDAAIRAAKPGEKARKLFDGEGLYLEVSPAGGAQCWVLMVASARDSGDIDAVRRDMFSPPAPIDTAATAPSRHRPEIPSR